MQMDCKDVMMYSLVINLQNIKLLVEPVKIDPDRQTPARQEMRRRAVARVVDFRSHELAGRHHAISRSSAGRRG